MPISAACFLMSTWPSTVARATHYSGPFPSREWRSLSQQPSQPVASPVGVRPQGPFSHPCLVISFYWLDRMPIQLLKCFPVAFTSITRMGMAKINVFHVVDWSSFALTMI